MPTLLLRHLVRRSLLLNYGSPGCCLLCIDPISLLAVVSEAWHFHLIHVPGLSIGTKRMSLFSENLVLITSKRGFALQQNDILWDQSMRKKCHRGKCHKREASIHVVYIIDLYSGFYVVLTRSLDRNTFLKTSQLLPILVTFCP